MPGEKLMPYEEVLSRHPDWLVIDTDRFWKEENVTLTEKSRLRVKRKLGIYLHFLQENRLLRRTLCDRAPDIPDQFKVYLRDMTPEGYELHRNGYQKWVDALDGNIDADPTNIQILEKSLVKIRAARGLQP